MELKTIIRVAVSFSVLFLVALPKLGLAEFSGPMTVIIGNLGNGENEFTISRSDMGDSVPGLRCVNSTGNIIIPDCVRREIKIYSNKGIPVSKITPKNIEIKYNWPGLVCCDSATNIYTSNWDNKLQKYNINGELIWEKEIYVADILSLLDDSIVIYGYRLDKKGKEKYLHVSSSGKLLKSYNEKPLELGLIESNRVSKGQKRYKINVKYPDITYEFYSAQSIERYRIDTANNFYQIQRVIEKDINDNSIHSFIVYKYDRCTNSEYQFELPKSEFEERPPIASKMPTWISIPVVEYGEPIISDIGDLYCWKRTPDTYSILKWVWIDNPDSPHSLTVTDSKAGLSLVWEKPNQDADKVTEYEIVRSTDICGEFNAIGKTKKPVLSYIDETVKDGETYYYKVRAVKSGGYSGYSNKTVGKL